MTMREKLAELKAEAEGLMGKIEEGDEKAIARGEELAGEIERAQKGMEAAERFSGILAGIGSAKKGAVEQARTLGEFAAKAMEGVERKGKFSASLGTFAKADPDPSTLPSTAGAASAAIADIQERVYEGPRRRLQIADLLGQESTTRSAVTYFVEGGVDGSVATVAENGKKPMIHLGEPTAVTEAVKKIAAVYKETDELLDDLPWLATSIDNRGVYLVQLFEEDQILNGDGKGNNLSGILTREGLLTEAVKTGEGNAADAIFRAMTAVANGSAFAADGIVMNPADYQELRLAKDGNSQYFGGGFFAGAYGNGSIAEQPPVWGLRTVVTPAIAKGTALVGAFAQGAAVIRRKGLTVEVANQNEDDFVSNRIAIRIEERLALAVRYPSAFAKVTLTAPASGNEGGGTKSSK